MKNVLILMVAGLLSCKTSQNKSEQLIDLNQIANDVLNEKCERSDMGDYALFSTLEKTPGILSKNILVLSMSNGEVVYGPQKLNAKVEWYEENILKIDEYRGVVEDVNKKDEGPYYYNILTKKKFSESR